MSSQPMSSATICPFCFHVHDFRSVRSCPATTYPVPDAYLEPGEESSPPLWLMTVGFRRHGKSCFVAALASVLETLQGCSHGSFTPLDRYTFDRLREMRGREVSGRVEPRTAAGSSRALLFQTRDLPGLGSRSLVVYDLPGESFDDFDKVAEYAPAMRAVQTVWLFVSLRDFDEDNEGRTLQELFAVYRAGMRRLRIGLGGRTVIVVFTKFDQQERPLRVREYLREDPLNERLRAAEDVEEDCRPADGDAPLRLDAEYRREMADISERLEHFTRKQVRGGAGFLNMARSEGMTVVFAAVSALGDEAERNGTRAADGSPYRVIDPLLWAAERSAPQTGRRFHLVLDEIAAEGAIAAPDVVELWHRLGGLGEVSTYILGRRPPAAGIGQPPPSPVRRTGSRLIGPLLESLSAGDRVLILAAGPILDLGDFEHTEWPRRTLIVRYGEGSPDSDRWQVLAPPGAADEVEPMVERFLRLS